MSDMPNTNIGNALPFQWSPKKLDLAKATVGKGLSDNEFELLIHASERLGVDPLLGQIKPHVFDADNPETRRFVLTTKIDGYRSIANKTGNYRPADAAPKIKINKALISPTNHLGIESCTVTVYKYVHSEWHPCVATIYWDEFVPTRAIYKLNETTQRNEPTDERQIDPSQSVWKQKPRFIIGIVAEAQALRRGWPDHYAGFYAEEEVHQDVAKTAEAREAATHLRESAGVAGAKAMAGPKTGPSYQLVFDEGNIEQVAASEVEARINAFAEANIKTPEILLSFQDRNSHELRAFFMTNKPAGLRLRRKFAAATAEANLAPDKELEVTA